MHGDDNVNSSANISGTTVGNWIHGLGSSFTHTN